MSLLDIVRSAVKIADQVTKPLQCDVTLEHYAGSDEYGALDPAPAPVTLKAIVDGKQQQVRTMAGVLSVSRATVMFLDVAALLAATNGEGINDQDVITLPDGTTGPILNLAGFVDAGTGQEVATEVYIG